MRELLALGKIQPRAPLVAAISGQVIIGAKGSVWRITPDAAEKLADDLVDMAELARSMEGQGTPVLR